MDIKEVTIWSLSNIVSDGDCLAVVMNTDLLKKIFNITNIAKISFIRNLASFFKNISVAYYNIDTMMVYKLIEIFSNYIYIDDKDVISDCLNGLSILSEKEVEMELFAKLLNRLLSIDYMEHDVIEILIIFGNITSRVSNDILESMYEMDLFEYLEAIMLNVKDKRVKRKVLWVVSNLCYSSNCLIDRLLNSNLINQIVKLIDDPLHTVRKEALWVFSNITAGQHFSHCLSLINKGLYSELMNIMNNVCDKEILEKALFVLDNIFSTGVCLVNISGKNPLVKKFEDIGGFDCLEKLQNHYSHDIFKKTEEIIKKYFEN
jgi:hypothetical protein